MQPPAATELLAQGGVDTLLDRPLIRGPRGVARAVGGLWFLRLSVLGLSEARHSPSEGVLSRLRDWERPLLGASQPWEQEPLSGRFQRQDLPLRPTSKAAAAGDAGAGDAGAGEERALTGVSLQRRERPGWFRGAGGGLQSSGWSLAMSSFLIQGGAQAGPGGLAPNRDSSQKDGV